MDPELSNSLVPVVLEDLAGPRPDRHFHVGMVGDIWVPDSLLDEAAVSLPGDLRTFLWQGLAGCALVIANLEAPITDLEAPVSNKPYNLHTSRRALEIFDSRFVLSLANNHIMDFGPQGLDDTIAALEDARIAYTGAGRDLDHARMPRYVEADGVKVAVIGAADPRFQRATTSTPGTNPAITELLAESVTEARPHAHLIVVTVHMGLEYAHLPSASQVRVAETCLAAGAHIVQFHHSHCLSGCSRNGSGVVLFGTGNYVFPDDTGYDIPKSRDTATWIARYSRRDDSIASLGMVPAVLDRKGLPRALNAAAADERVRQIQTISRRMLAPVWRRFWRAYDLLHPSFVLPTLHVAREMVRRQGLINVTRILFAGVRGQMLR
jgi:poly-gamma-glutamate capsule biosynthesis protein CapA/YwtB (metallophosphatase superfamily)